jgi:predicted nucleotidyltransferase component of viral defense system
MSVRRYRHDPRTNEQFGIAVLAAISGSPADNVLRRNLVLKGGAALLLVYGSGRATRKDLDFDVTSDDRIDRDPIDELLARLRSPWNARLDPREGKDGFEIFDDALNVGPIQFRHARQLDVSGKLMLQISQRKVPPYLATLIKPYPLLDPTTGKEFDFPIASLEVIAAEKSFRSVSRSGPYTNDFYDLGYVLERQFGEGTVRGAFNEICGAESFKLARDRQDAEMRRRAKVAKGATKVEDLFVDQRVLDQGVAFDVAKRRVLSGMAYVRELAGLPAIRGVAVWRSDREPEPEGQA